MSGILGQFQEELFDRLIGMKLKDDHGNECFVEAVHTHLSGTVCAELSNNEMVKLFLAKSYCKR